MTVEYAYFLVFGVYPLILPHRKNETNLKIHVFSLTLWSEHFVYLVKYPAILVFFGKVMTSVFFTHFVLELNDKKALCSEAM